MKAFRSLTIASFKMFLRDRTTFFFSIAFPFLFLFVFGFVFQNTGATSPSLYRYAYLIRGDGFEGLESKLEEVFNSKGIPVSSVEEGFEEAEKRRGGRLRLPG